MTFREVFWRFLAAKLVRNSSQRLAHRLPDPADTVVPIPIHERYPGLRGLPSLVAQDVPKTEQMATKQLVLRRVALAIKPWLPLWTLLEPYLEDDSSYAPELVDVTSAPWRPESFSEGADVLADIATRGPFSLYTRRRDDGDYEIDVTKMLDHPVKEGFLTGGGRVTLRARDGRLVTTRLEVDGETFTPADEGFAAARSRFLCGLGSWVTIADHITRIHLLVCGTFSVCTVAHLPAGHPLRVLLQPSIVETIRVNNYFVGLLLGSESSAAPSYTRYDLSTLHAVVRQESEGFDLRCMDPCFDRNDRQVADLQGMVTVEGACELWDLFHSHALEYCNHFLAAPDAPTRAWVEAIHEAMPGGILRFLGLEDLGEVGPAHVARLVCVLSFTASVRHNLIGDMTRNYYLYPHWFPPAVPEGGGPPPRGVVMEKANAIAVSAIQRYWLLDDTIPTVDDTARAMLGRFQDGLRAYRSRMAARPEDFRYVPDPEALMSSVHQ